MRPRRIEVWHQTLFGEFYHWGTFATWRGALDFMPDAGLTKMRRWYIRLADRPRAVQLFLS